MNLYEFLKSSVSKYNNQIFFCRKQITYNTFLELVKKRAAFLLKEGFKSGDVIGILSKNSADWVITYFAITSIGAYALLLDTNLFPNDYEAMTKEVDAKAVFTSKDLNYESSNLKIYDISIDGNLENINEFKPANVSENHIASLSFTSGTTGNPKIVPLTHKNVITTAVSNVKTVLKHEDLQDETIYGLLPIYHVYGMTASFMVALAAGAKVAFTETLNPKVILKELQEYKVKVFPGVPRLWELFYNKIEQGFKEKKLHKLFKLLTNHGIWFKRTGLGKVVNHIFKPVRDMLGGNISIMLSGGAPLKPTIENAFNNMGFRMIQGYGLTETVGPFSLNPPVNGCEFSVGPPAEGNYAEIRNTNKDGIGEVWLKGASVFPEYYKNKEATEKSFDADGWYNSGDLGYMDKKGFIYIMGRKKNVIVLDSGKNVYPEELENHFKSAPEIEEISVFGYNVNDRNVVYAVVVPSDENMKKEEIELVIKRYNDKLPMFKKVTHYAVSYEPLPKTSTQKIKPHIVKKNLEAGKYIKHHR